MSGTELVVVTLPAEIDMANADCVSEQIAAAFAVGPKAVIADMTVTTFCDSTGIRVLVLAHKRAAADGAELRLLRPCRRVLRIMEVLGVDAVLPIYHSLEQALAGGGEAEAESWSIA
jgi:anti-sigma B factor antagonist